MIQQYETVEMTSPNTLLISVDATKYEIAMRTFVRKYSELIGTEEVQSKYNLSAVYPPESEFLRAGFLYQALLCGDESELIAIKNEAVQLIKNIQLLEKCIKKEVIDAR